MEENKTDNNFEKENKPLNTPSTDEPIMPAAETSDIINPPSYLKNMEIHHHHDHGKKSWKSYFQEFLMWGFIMYSIYT